MNATHKTNSENNEIKYGTQEINGEICKIVAYTEPITRDQIVLVSPPRRETSAYRNGTLTGITMHMVQVQMKINEY